MYKYLEHEDQDIAENFISDLTNKLFNLASLGVTGSSRDFISSGLRAFPYRERCFYYRIIEDKMIVVRVLHGKQDINSQKFL